MQHRIGLAIWCLHIGAILVALLLFVPVVSLSNYQTVHLGVIAKLVMFLFCIALVGGIEIVNSGLRRRRFWAWVAALCIPAVYLPSILLPLGTLGLWGLLGKGSRAEFGIGLDRSTGSVNRQAVQNTAQQGAS
jgi:hypothetical protein